MGTVTAAGLAGGALALGSLAGGGPQAMAAFAAGTLLAGASAVGGFALLGRAMRRGATAFRVVLLAIFLCRIALVGLLGIALAVAIPAHLAIGLLALVGFHFVFALIEIALLARPGAAAAAGRG